MKILRITGATTDDERRAVCEVLAIWDHDGTCSADLIQRLPTTRLEILIAFDDPYDTSEAIIVIENNTVSFYPLDNSEPETVH
jgi:hypothetical protein